MRVLFGFCIGITALVNSASALDNDFDDLPDSIRQIITHYQTPVRTELTQVQLGWVQQINNSIQKGVIIKMTITQKSKGLIGIRARGSACHSWNFNCYKGNYTCDRQSAINFLNYYLNNESVVMQGLNVLPELSGH